VNSRQIRNIVDDTCRLLNQVGIAPYFSSPTIYNKGDRELVTWPVAGQPESTNGSFASLDQYLLWLRGEQYTCLLHDFSIVRASYECIGNEVVGHTLLYWSCPIDCKISVETANDMCLAIEEFIANPRGMQDYIDLRLRGPMRFDFDPRNSAPHHPSVHLHVQFEESRLFVEKPLEFPSFVKAIIRTFYHFQWQNVPDICTVTVIG